MQQNTREKEKPPAIVLSSVDAQVILDAINTLKKEMVEQMRDVNSRFAQLSKTDIEFKGALGSLRDDFNRSRISRLEMEIDEGQRELQLLEEKKATLAQQLEVKKKVQDGAVDTDEKIRLALEAAARTRKDKQEQFWMDVRASVIKSLFTWAAIGVVASLVGLVWWLILFRAGAAP